MKVNLGCGFDYRVGWLNVDKVCRNRFIDLKWDIERRPLPEKHEYILLNNVAEHLSVKGILNVIYSLKVGGVLEVIVPHYLSRHAYNDLTHIHYFNEHCFKVYPFSLLDIVDMDVWYCFGSVLRFHLPVWFVGLQERFFGGFCPPSHIVVRLKKNVHG